jgi:histidyl-tRNA synthetase
MMISRVKGTQDFLDLSVYNFIIAKSRHHFEKYYFHEIATPLLESVDLFKRTLGIYTDVVSKEMFLITPTPGSKDQLCLRPEATASTMRAFLENHIQTIPWKVFSHGPMFRYERPQKGRFRQFHQINIEAIGVESVANDVQLLTMLDRLFSEVFKLDTYVLAVNTLGCAQDRKAYQRLLQEFLTSAHAAHICETCQVRKDANALRVFDCKNEQCQAIYLHAPATADVLCDACAGEWEQLRSQLHLLGVSFTYERALVRGLDYYNKTVFEFVSSSQLGAQNAFCGGGRYELATQLGAKKAVPALGAAIGIERLMLMLEPLRAQIAIAALPAVHVVMPLTEKQQSLALLVADTLYAHNICADVLLDGHSVKHMMQQANKMGAATALLIGETEQETNSVTVKNMVTGAQQLVPQVDLVAYLRK